VAFFGAAWVFTVVLSPGVNSGTDSAGGDFVRACLVGVSKAVAVLPVGGRVSGVDWSNLTNS
jgi:hypothetical protein